MTDVRFGIIGLGLMGREFASAAARWLHLQDPPARPVITAVCDPNPDARRWFEDHVPTVEFSTATYQELLNREDIDAVYVAVPHHLHAEIYVAVMRAGKHLMGEKPFGIDMEANQVIVDEAARHPDLTVRCSSEMPFFPGALAAFSAVANGEVGTILDAEASFLHSSDMNPKKAINWKRQQATNGAYGCMGDLGMHVLHLPLRLGWKPHQVHAVLSNVMPERPDGQGGMALCDTWDNATLLTRVRQDGRSFPLSLHTKRMSPGDMNTWSFKVHGTETSVAFSTKHPKTFWRLRYTPGNEQAWEAIDTGSQSAYPTLTGGIFEFGFSDAIQQMWAAYVNEVVTGETGPLGCVTPEETRMQHEIFTQALKDAEA